MVNYRTRRFLGLYLLILLQNVAVQSKIKPPEPRKESLVEIRAVYINCESDDKEDNLDSPSVRFERQELFKHNALRGCNKKLAVTVKITSPQLTINESTGTKDEMDDEYIPIDHVFEGPEKKRVRLLNPYILRLRRERPKQAYKLQRIDTVKGVLRISSTNLRKYAENQTAENQESIRDRRQLDDSEKRDEDGLLLGSAASMFTLDHDDPNHHSYSVRIGRLQELIKAASPSSSEENSQDCGLRLYNNQYNLKSQNLKPSQEKKIVVLYENGKSEVKREVCSNTDNSTLGRVKREDQVMMTVIDDFEGRVTPRYTIKTHYDQSHNNEEDLSYNMQFNEKQDEEDTRYKDDYVTQKSVHPRHSAKNKNRHSKPHSTAWKIAKNKATTKTVYDDEKSTEHVALKKIFRPETEFALYEIGNPKLWYDVKVHLFEKVSTSEGKTVWNDLTEGVDASVNSEKPEWKGQAVNVRYRPTEWVPREEFTLPVAKLGLLEPLVDNFTAFDDDDTQQPNANTRNYIVVPLEDVVYMGTDTNKNKRNENTSATLDYSSDQNNQIRSPRRVEVRVSRAIMGGVAEHFDIAQLGQEQFLTIPHQRPHRSQIEVEVRADDNVLVRVGSSGRLATVVTDNSRLKRTTVYFQATNTGLASARFKAVVRECGPELSTLLKDTGSDEISSESILLPPHHTRRVKVEVPAEIPVDVTHCNVALVNDEDVAVAVRDVSIKKGDRCFCVWHCECVCLSEDPKLLCREMSQTQQVAAGLAPSERPRYTRSVSYKDNMTLDFFTVMLGVIVFLLLLGFIKAVLGLWNVRLGQFGWERVLGTPRIISCYFEPCLRHRPVVYQNGWPVHPDTKLRTVRVLSCPASFLLNLVFFILLFCIGIHNTILRCLMQFRRCLKTSMCELGKKEEVYNAHDLQSGRLRRKHKPKLADWMSPFADHLISDVIKKSVEPALREHQNEMRPLLHDTKMCKSDATVSVPDSEQEDTDYVLMQMQKSRESLAKSQNK